jgi:hypothetical protein
VEKESFVPSSLKRVRQKLEVNRGSRSEIIIRDKPLCRKTLSKYTWAIAGAVVSSEMGAIFISLDNRSTKTAMPEFPRTVLGNPTIRYDSYLFPPVLGDRNGLQKIPRAAVAGFVDLALSTGPDVMPNVLLELCPKEGERN